MIMKNGVMITLCSIVIVNTALLVGCIQPNGVTYRVTFDATWSVETHPDDFPANPHFSGLIGASHNSAISFWKEGELASPGIKNVAELGSKNPLNIEIGNAILNNTAFWVISGDGIGTSPGSVDVEFMVNEDYPLVTLVAMIAPSPDWFVGVETLNLYEDGSSFVDEKTVTLYAFDAGTDSGTTYTSPNNPTNPPVTVSRIEGYPFFYENELVSLGTFTFVKVNDDSSDT